MRSLLNISPVDGRYSAKTETLSEYFSELALMKYRVKVELRWFLFYAQEIEGKTFSKEIESSIHRIYNEFSLEDGEKVKSIESKTNHDVKAVEYFLRERISHPELQDKLEWLHLFCTSEDINNLAYNLMLKDALENHWLPLMEKTYWEIYQKGLDYSSQGMMARTHGQPASPTTMGKEWINYCSRTRPFLKELKNFKFTGKFNGATGNFNAHFFSKPNENWLEISEKFILSLGLTPNLFTTQIEPHDTWGRFYSILQSVNQILIDFCKDIWLYISMDYFTQRRAEGEVGSSTMPHKVNPIDFENCEGNLGLANALNGFFMKKLTNSRLQRDLSDSTVERNMGMSFAYSTIALKSLLKGLSKLEINPEKINADLTNNYQVLAEAVQSVLRLKNYPDPYDLLKKATRGKKITKENYPQLIEALPIEEELKKEFLKLKPENYIGLAKNLVDHFNPKL